jgi:hypothetical protein
MGSSRHGLVGPGASQELPRLMLAILGGWLLSWLGVAALITLSVARPHNPIPRILLEVWAGLSAISLAIPGGSPGASRGRLLMLVLAAPFLPLARVGAALWPHLPDTVKDLLEGNFRSHLWARQQRKHARLPGLTMAHNDHSGRTQSRARRIP